MQELKTIWLNDSSNIYDARAFVEFPYLCHCSKLADLFDAYMTA